MKFETVRCDVCGIICTNASEEYNGRDYCLSCAKNMGLITAK